LAAARRTTFVVNFNSSPLGLIEGVALLFLVVVAT
jgi:hypothetical protein